MLLFSLSIPKIWNFSENITILGFRYTTAFFSMERVLSPLSGPLWGFFVVEVINRIQNLVLRIVEWGAASLYRFRHRGNAFLDQASTTELRKIAILRREI